MIYFITPKAGGRIKIGTTVRLTERLKQLAKEAGEELQVLAVVDGSHETERALHRRFAHLRVVREWFEPGDDLLGFIVEEGKSWDGADEGPAYAPVKLHLDVIRTARIVAALRNVSVTDLLSEILGPILERMEQEEVAKRLQ